MSPLEKYLLNLTASVSDRQKGARFVSKHPDYFNPLLLMALDPKGERVHVMSSWVLETILLEKISLLIPHFNYFLKQLPKIENPSMQRPLSKILFYFLADEQRLKKLEITQIDQILTIAFYWIITSAKTATFSFAIKIINLLKTKQPWVEESLRQVVQNESIVKTPGKIAAIKRVFKE